MKRMKSSFSTSRRRVLAMSAMTLGGTIAISGLAGCGFELRKPPVFAFKTIAVRGTSATVNLLRRNLRATGTLTVVEIGKAGEPVVADAILEVVSEDRTRVVLSTNAAGEVRELDLVLNFKFKLSTPAGKELLPTTTIEQRRDLTYNETNAIAKESEADLLYRDMQNEIAQQTVRRLGAVKQL
jgi:LPS-assembly lipoprotein